MFYPPTHPGTPIAPLLRDDVAEFRPGIDPTCVKCGGAPVDEGNDDVLCASCVGATRRWP